MRAPSKLRSLLQRCQSSVEGGQAVIVAGRSMASSALLCACLLALGVAGSAASIRGLDPALADRYVALDGQFTCLDGKKRVPFAQVNDDYCDCFDGSDEPGTSACSNSKFYCPNRGAVPIKLNASMVDDGICGALVFEMLCSFVLFFGQFCSDQQATIGSSAMDCCGCVCAVACDWREALADCCDGSDERPGRCPNRCKEVGSALLDGLRALVAAAQAGMAKREKYFKDAAAAKKDWAKRKTKLEAQVTSQRPKVDALAAEKKKLEDQVSKLEEEKQRAEGAAKAAGAPPSAPPAEEGGEAAGAGGDAVGAGGEAAGAAEGGQAAGTAEGGQAAGGAVGGEAGGTEEASGGEEAAAAQGEEEAAAEEGDASSEVEGETLTEEEMREAMAAAEEEERKAEAREKEEEERRAQEVMAQWVPGARKEGGGGEEERPAAEEAAPEGEDQLFRGPEEPVGGGGAAGAGGGADGGGGGEESAAPEPGTGSPAAAVPGLLERLLGRVLPKLFAKSGSAQAARVEELERKLAAVRKQLEGARSRHGDADSALRSAESEASSLGTKLGREYGEGDVFAALADRCFTANVEKYVYEVCPFGSAAQKEGGASTSLGNWEGFRDSYSVMAFTSGAYCWQGPARTMTVTLKCGQSEQLRRVQEPSRCEYTAELVTPAACSEAQLAALRRDLSEKEALLEAALHDEL
eukprot:scaffold3.g6740.t1